jgi:hypothetical protein
MVKSLKQQFSQILLVVKETFGKTMEQLHAEGMSGVEFLAKLGPGLAKHFESGLVSWNQSLQSKMQQTHNDFLRLQLQMGADLEPFYMSLMNGIIAVTSRAKELWAFFVLHKEVIKSVANIVLMVGEVWLGYAAVIGIATLATKIYIGIQSALNLVMSLNPIGAVIAGILALTAAVIYSYNHFAIFRAWVFSVWAGLKEFVSSSIDILRDLGVMLHGVFTLNPTEIALGFNAANEAVKDQALRLATAAKFGWAQGMADFGGENKSTPKSLIPNGVKPKSNFNSELAALEPKTKATGSKSVTINVKINDLIGTYNSNVTNLKESSEKVREIIVQVLSGAVNDFQIVAGE